MLSYLQDAQYHRFMQAEIWDKVRQNGTIWDKKK